MKSIASALTVALVAIAFLLVVCSGTAAPFLDDFSTDTLGNYVGTKTYGTGPGGFTVSGGTLNVDGTVGATYDVFHKTANLEVGETVRVVSTSGNPTDLYLSISTTTRGPNTTGEHGIRLHWNSPGTVRARVYNNGTAANTTFGGTVASGTEMTLFIMRNSDTEYTVGYDAGAAGSAALHGITIAGTAGQDLYIGVEEYASNSSFDDLEILDLSSEPFLDDFSADTSGNYIGTRTFGSGTCSFDVSGGTLNVAAGVNSTYDVFHKTAALEIGKTVRVVSKAGNPGNLRLTISTTTRGPNTTGEHGIRLIWNGTFRAQVYNNGSGTDTSFGGTVPAGTELTLFIMRNTDTEYTVGYEAGDDGSAALHGITIAGTSGQGLYIGVEGYNASYSCDDLEILDLSTEPFLDDFNADTSGNYIGTKTYGTGPGGFTVSGGALNVDGTVGATYDVFHKVARLGIGRTVRVVSKMGNPRDLYLSISTTTRGPNTPGEHGLRLNWTGSGTVRARVYDNGLATDTTFGGTVASGTEMTLSITRYTDTSYTVRYNAGVAGSDELGSLSIPGTAGKLLYIGVEEFGSNASFDDLRIYSVGTIFRFM